jgi:hypothetical protein
VRRKRSFQRCLCDASEGYLGQKRKLSHVFHSLNRKKNVPKLRKIIEAAEFGRSKKIV